jgi:large subunit ribosomal protein L31
MIHPSSYRTLTRCSNCGAEHDLTSTREHLRIDVCSNCHPFFTGTEARVARGGQIARFEARRRRAEGASA